ncbi:MAG: ABC transporter ATP-binding protein [Mycobacteriales bacterium]
MLLEVEDLSVSYRTGRDSVRAVRGISFQIGAGGTLAFAGESGSGKSTVALSLLRLLPASATMTGTVRFRGESLLDVNWEMVRAVRWAGASIVFQGAMSALNPVRTIGQQIREPILLHERVGERAARIRTAELLDAVGVSEGRAGSYPHELSGGQRQRVMIAMALACRPNLVIADEPTTALDVIVQAQILNLLTDLVRDTQIGMIMISHDLSVLAETCDRMAIMYAGRIIETGPSRDMIRRPLHPYTRALAQAFPRIGDPGSRLAPAGLAGDPPDLRQDIDGCAFAPRCDVSFGDCTTHPIELWPSGERRESACLRALPDFANRLPDPAAVAEDAS